jgi:uncharacterized membrane protein YidH (DUF202 family)
MAEQKSNTLITDVPHRPERLPVTPVPPLPKVDESNSESASTQYSHYRTGLSNHRTGLSEHRTSLSEYRTDLSMHRTDLSTHRTDLSEGRTEMSMRRTGMSFQRTRLSADRTLMSIMRTSLSLISFGFTIFQFFEKMKDQTFITHAAAPRNFGVTLVLLGILMLIIGIAYHVQFMLGLRSERKAMVAEGLLHGESKFPPSMVLIVAIILLVIGFFAIVSMVFQIGPFG